MEAIVAIALLFFGGFIIRALVAGGKSAVTGQSFGESYRGFPDWSFKLEEKTFDKNSKFPIKHKEIFCRGLFPITITKKIAVLVKLLDVTDKDGSLENRGPWEQQKVNREDTNHPVITFLDSFQEPGSTVFEFYRELGEFNPNTGFKDWISIATIPHEFLQTAYSGERKIQIFCIIEDVANPYSPDNPSGLISFKKFDFTHNFKTKGYLEASEDIEKARGIAVKIAVGVAMSDGSLDDKEGEVIKNWIKKTVNIFDDAKSKELKKIYNEAFKDSYKLAKQNKLILSDLTEDLNQLDENKIKYDAMELCYEVMAADGVAEPQELKTIRAIGESLNIDAKEIENMRDRNLMNLSSNAASPSIEEILGIDSSWSKDKIKTHLTNEFQKWNNRISSLPDGDEKENAQSMLNKIAELRRKNGI